jgi:hypothetical protein
VFFERDDSHNLSDSARDVRRGALDQVIHDLPVRAFDLDLITELSAALSPGAAVATIFPSGMISPGVPRIHRGHHVNKATGPETQKGSNLVTALQEVKAGTNGWLEVR